MAKKKNIKKNTQREKSKVKISSDNPYSFRNYIEFFLWLVVILLSLVGLIKRNNILYLHQNKVNMNQANQKLNFT